MAATDPTPPLTNTLDGELGRVVCDPDVDQALVSLDIVDPIGDRDADREAAEVVDVDLARIALWSPGRASRLTASTAGVETTARTPGAPGTERGQAAKPRPGRDTVFDGGRCRPLTPQPPLP
jgi:hypothetical protein